MSKCDSKGFKLPDYREDPDNEVSGNIFREIGQRFDKDLERPSKGRSA
jgi:hypothetical protein